MVTRLQLLRYPFSSQARQASQGVARDIGALIDTIEEPGGNYVIREASNRVFAALNQEEITTVNTNDDRDFLIYSASRLIVEKLGDNRLKQYQAEAESKSVNKHLGNEPDDFVLDLCQTSFNWNLELIGGRSTKSELPLYLRSFDFFMPFVTFLEIAPRFHADEWKLVNRIVEDGQVPIRKSELHRMISEKFKVLILNSSLNVPTLPRNLSLAVQQIESELKVKLKRTEPIKFTEQTVTAFPPCISQMHAAALEGRNLSHDARFTLAAFLLKIGMSDNEVLGIFRAAPDFVRGLAEYQVKHIASKSGGEGYTPPSCRKLQGNSLCPVYLGSTSDPLCEYIVHPLAFYETRAWEMSKGIKNHSWYAKKRKKVQNF
ncbi:MAG: hypothetical protein ACFFED_04710 [Candidatus Thorarchaeota archaeon]